MNGWRRWRARLDASVRAQLLTLALAPLLLALAGLLLALAAWTTLAYDRLLPGLDAGASILGSKPLGAGVVVVGMALGVLLMLGLDAFIPVLVSADDVTNHKPHPDTFLRVAELLGANPANCLVFEDTPIGIEAGKAGGMATVLSTEGELQRV